MHEPISLPPEATTGERPRSVPPPMSTRVIVAAHSVEIVSIVAFTVALCLGALSEQSFMVLMGGALIGPAVGKMRGKAITSGVLLMTAAQGAKAAGAAGAAAAVTRSLSTILLVVVTGLMGCGGSEVRPDDIHGVAEEARQELKVVQMAADAAFVAASIACSTAPELPGDFKVVCGALVPQHVLYKTTWQAAWAAVDLFESGARTATGEPMTKERLDGTIRDVREFLRLWRDVERAIETMPPPPRAPAEPGDASTPRRWPTLPIRYASRSSASPTASIRASRFETPAWNPTIAALRTWSARRSTCIRGSATS